ncbi:NDR1/HIN1-like protein 6 [Macadamia integrifolia]|uniref:NDR1/HIN1-like protein 6 n=1 Tax=Macadamia integrifolia TaxID=60698 RepID=UPI001C4E93DF|nr:NDR1/HIN1-like protein 6 [Macadamia integrifolia]
MNRPTGATQPILQRPPGYRDPNSSIPTPVKPPIRKQPPPLPPSFHPKRKRRSYCRRCCCCFFCFFLLLIIIVAAAGGLFYLWYQPKLPIFRLKSIDFPSFNVSITADGTYLDSKTIVRFETENPNKKKITFYYGHTDVVLTTGGDIDLGSATLPGFTQVAKNITILKFATQVKHLMINDEGGAKLKSQLLSKNMVVSAEVHTQFGLGVEKMKLGNMAVKILCKDVSLKQLSGGTTTGCSINLLKWINLKL